MLGYVMYRLKLKNILLIAVTFASSFYVGEKFFYFRSSEISHPIILWWTPFTGDVDRVITCHEKYKCLLTKNRIKYRNNTQPKSFLFYGTDFDVRDLPVPKTDTWAIFHEESPRNSAIFLFNRTFELFNITATFSRYSDIPLTLQYLENLSVLTDTRHIVSIEEKNKLLHSIAPVLYIQSDCDTPVERDGYVKELMKHISVDSYGGCLTNKKFPREIAAVDALDLYNDKLLHFLSKYKFMISFENAICEDYITEKLWRPLQAGTVPIYLGSPSVQDWLPNVNSAILAKNFESPKALAGFLHKINGNDSMYKLFLEHKYGQIENSLLKNTLKTGPYGIATDQEHPVPAFECFVCEALHDKMEKQKSLHSIYDCVRPKEGSIWNYYWESGDCKSKALVNFVKHNKNLEIDFC